jgi:SAM-dependent methyltransferase
MKIDHVSGWHANYVGGRFNRYPYDSVVSFVLRNFGGLSLEERARLKFLDLGCGGGNHVKFLRDEGFDGYGADGAEEGVRLTRDLIGPAAADRVVTAYFHDLPFDDGFFDGIIDRQSIGHNRGADIPAILAEIHRVLRPGGLYFGHVFSLETSAFRHGRDFGAGDYGHFTGGDFKSSVMVHAFDRPEIELLFAAFDLAGLKSVATRDLLNPDEFVVVFEIIARRR